ncbi:DUF4430 domain-containing protein [Oceanobacillus indicireducens]|uniref:Transcobalamin-like C-terminal domain-containing protein n=1 Tax=Oceanobacillus indicireducens TaxID=1004261 RepID=A0A917Y1D7_9BACI|nr:DUF4430 domain-containing protein [Oceanobacillus indicireducens]GGN60871.1 hypothetical protein GCM10007971_25350 [Oceanobacillus indicireducens]
MKQVFRLALITFSMILLVACGGQQAAIQVEKISVIPTSAVSMETKELIKVRSNTEKADDEDAEESEASEENTKKEEKESTVADSSEDTDNESTTTKTDANQSTNKSANSNESTPNTNQQKDHTNHSAGNSNKQSANTGTSKSSDSTNTNTPSQPKNEQPNSNPKPKEEAKPAPKTTAFVSVESPGDLNGPNLAPTEVEITDGETALAATLRALNSKGISVDYTGSGATAYVKSIGGLGEFDAGPLSGWNVFVEGIMIPRSADAYEIFDGYKVHWRYTKNYLED